MEGMLSPSTSLQMFIASFASNFSAAAAGDGCVLVARCPFGWVSSACWSIVAIFVGTFFFLESTDNYASFVFM